MFTLVNYIENVTGITFLGVCDNEKWLILSSFYAKEGEGFVAQAWNFSDLLGIQWA